MLNAAGQQHNGVAVAAFVLNLNTDAHVFNNNTVKKKSPFPIGIKLEQIFSS
jgi:hypothetical protein